MLHPVRETKDTHSLLSVLQSQNITVHCDERHQQQSPANSPPPDSYSFVRSN